MAKAQKRSAGCLNNYLGSAIVKAGDGLGNFCASAVKNR